MLAPARAQRVARPPRCGCASTPASATATATRPTPAASTASTASGTPTCPRRWRPSRQHGLRARRPAHAHRLGRRLQPPGRGVRRHGGPGARGVAAGHDLHAISAGGGLSIPYRAGDAGVDTAHYFSLWDARAPAWPSALGHPLQPGDRARPLPGGRGRRAAGRGARHQDTGSNHFVLVDAGFNDLMRPAMYGSYHAIERARAATARARGRRASPPWSPARCASRATSSRRTTAAWCCRATCPRPRSATCWCSTTPAPTARRCPPTTTRRPLAAEVLVDGGQAAPDPPPPDGGRAAGAWRSGCRAPASRGRGADTR